MLIPKGLAKPTDNLGPVLTMLMRRRISFYAESGLKSTRLFFALEVERPDFSLRAVPKAWTYSLSSGRKWELVRRIIKRTVGGRGPRIIHAFAGSSENEKNKWPCLSLSGTSSFGAGIGPTDTAASSTRRCPPDPPHLQAAPIKARHHTASVVIADEFGHAG